MQSEDSLTDQQRTCREAAAKNGHCIDPAHEYSDAAVSGTKRDRDGLNRLLADAEAGEFATLYIHSLSRLARESVITMPTLKRLVHTHGVRVICLAENIDTSLNGWELIASIMAVMHEQYVKELGANVRRGQEGVILAGHCVGDYCFGYTSEPIPGSETKRGGKNAKPQMRYVIHDENAEWVRRIFRCYVEDQRSLTWIAKELTRLGAPKDHRSSSPHWRASLVANLLRREKYVGVWPWGRNRNVRDPETGQVHQELRDQEETARWTRQLDHLRIIDDATFQAAQRRLNANAAANQEKRRRNGEWKTGGGQAGASRHLLSCLIECGQCGARFYVGGANGNYLFCPNYKKGACSCKTTLNRERAERLILSAIARCIGEDEAWFECLFDAMLKVWRESESRVPRELRALQRSLEAKTNAIERLLDRIERGDSIPGVGDRLRQRQAEKRDLEKSISALTAELNNRGKEPTKLWLRERLAKLGETLHGDAPAAAHALRRLVGGKIVVDEIRNPGGQRHTLRGRFSIVCSPYAFAQNVDGANLPSNAEQEIVLDFVEPPKIVEDSELAKAMLDRGMLQKEIAAECAWSRSYVTKAIHYWYASRGLEPPDGRKRRSKGD